MIENELTIQILQGIRSDLQQSNRDNSLRFEALNEAMNQRFEVMNQRFEVIETALRDMAEQLVMQSRAIKAAIEVRANVEHRLENHEERLARLERASP